MAHSTGVAEALLNTHTHTHPKPGVLVEGKDRGIGGGLEGGKAHSVQGERRILAENVCCSHLYSCLLLHPTALVVTPSFQLLHGCCRQPIMICQLWNSHHHHLDSSPCSTSRSSCCSSRTIPQVQFEQNSNFKKKCRVLSQTSPSPLAQCSVWVHSTWLRAEEFHSSNGSMGWSPDFVTGEMMCKIAVDDGSLSWAHQRSLVPQCPLSEYLALATLFSSIELP